MGRYRGIGMPRAKKKKVEEVEEVEEVPEEAHETPEPEPPPSPKPSTRRAVAPESPSKSLLFAAQKDARKVARKAAREARAFVTQAERKYEEVKAVFERRIKRLTVEENRKLPVKKPPAWRQLMKTSQAELDLSKGLNQLLQGHLRALRAHGRVDAAEIELRDAKIVRLKRQLRIAKRPKGARRGWSTTRVRFRV